MVADIVFKNRDNEVIQRPIILLREICQNFFQVFWYNERHSYVFIRDLTACHDVSSGVSGLYKLYIKFVTNSSDFFTRCKIEI